MIFGSVILVLHKRIMESWLWGCLNQIYRRMEKKIVSLVPSCLVFYA